MSVESFKETFSLGVWHQAFNFGLLAVLEPPRAGKDGSAHLYTSLPGTVPIEVPEEIEKRSRPLLRAETKSARERVIFKHVFRDSFGEFNNGNISRARELYAAECSAAFGKTLWPDQDVTDLVKAQRKVAKRNSQGVTLRFILAALWDGVLSHLNADSRVHFLEDLVDFEGYFQRRHEVVRDAVRDLRLPSGPGGFKLTLKKK